MQFSNVFHVLFNNMCLHGVSKEFKYVSIFLPKELKSRDLAVYNMATTYSGFSLWCFYDFVKLWLLLFCQVILHSYLMSEMCIVVYLKKKTLLQACICWNYILKYTQNSNLPEVLQSHAAEWFLFIFTSIS